MMYTYMVLPGMARAKWLATISMSTLRLEDFPRKNGSLKKVSNNVTEVTDDKYVGPWAYGSFLNLQFLFHLRPNL